MTKILIVDIVYDLDACPRNRTNNFKFKNCLSGATNRVKNSDKEKYIYKGYGITFESTGSWSFDNGIARNVIIFGLDNSSSPHSDNPKNNFFVLDQGPAYGINGSFGPLKKKKISINSTKANRKFCSSLHYNADNIYLFVNEKQYLNLKLTIKMLTFKLNVVSKVYLIYLVILSLEKYR